MKIKVIKCTSSKWWYADKVGQTFEDVELYKHNNVDYRIRGPIICLDGTLYDGGGGILKTDAVLVDGMVLKHIKKHRMGKRSR